VSVFDQAGTALLDKKEAFFSITDNTWKVARDSLACFFARNLDVEVYNDRPDYQGFLDFKAGLADRSYYANYLEFAAAPDDYFELVPAEGSPELWRNGTFGYLMTRRGLKAMVEAIHEAGLKAVLYLNPYSAGRRAIEMFQKHPDWFTYDRTGAPKISFGHQQMALLREGKIASAYADWVSGPYANINFANHQVVDVLIDQLVKTAKDYGFDGTRFDNTCIYVNPDDYDYQGHPVAKSRQEAGEKTVWALEHMRERLTKEVGPQYLVGHNFGYSAHDWIPAPGWQHVAAKGWMVMEEITGPALGYSELPGAPRTRPWTDCVETLRLARNAAWAQGGHYQMIVFGNHDVPDPNPADPAHPAYTTAEASWEYQNLLAMASGVHPMNDNPYGRVKSFNRFVARYSALVYDNTMRPVEKPGTQIAVHSDRPLWWRDFVYVRKGDQGQIQTVMHLINPPLYPMHANPKNELPSPVESVPMLVNIPPRCTFLRAVLLEPEKEEALTVLPATTAGGKVRVVVPKVDLWSVVVFEWKPAGPQVFETLAPPPTEAAQADLNPAAQAAWVASTRVGADNALTHISDAGLFQGRTATTEKVPDPDTRSGFALKARAGVTENWYMAVGTFSTFERFGKYRITFRVKCSDNTVEDNVVDVGCGVEWGGDPHESVHHVLKGTDFAAPNKYQDFTVDTVRGDDGYFFYYMGYRGHADVSVDTITSERVGDVTDQELAQLFGIQPVATQPLGQIPAKLLWVQGLFHEIDPFAPGIQQLNLPYQVVEVDARSMRGFPTTWEELSQYSVVLLSDFDPILLRFAGGTLLRDWVQQGGTLLVTGGPFVLGKGLTKGTALDGIYPVEVSPWDLKEGGAFSAAGPVPEGCPVYDGTAAGSFWVHKTVAKPQAQVVLQCGKDPLLVVGKAGLGKVVVFTGTALESEAKVTPYWTDPGWGKWSEKFLGSTIR